MEITLEKIELVKDRTGVTYKEAKEALEACEGSVVDAIIAIEESVDVKKGGKINEFADDTIGKVKELIRKGNVSKICVKRDNEVLVNIPVSVGIVGAVVAPWGVLAAAIATFGFKCRVEVVTDDGRVIDVTEKTDNVATQVKEKGSVIIDEVKEKAPEVWGDAKEKGQELFGQAKEKAPEIWQSVKEKTPDTWEDVKGMAQEKFEQLRDRIKKDESLDELLDALEREIEEDDDVDAGVEIEFDEKIED